jgi:hypothetical protein
MKRQTLLQVVIFSFLLVLMSGISFALQYRAARASQHTQETRLGTLVLDIPEAFGAPRAYRDQTWDVREYRGAGLGTLRIATEPADGSPWEKTCIRWFGLDRFPSGATAYSSQGVRWFFKPVPVLGPAAYILRKQGKPVRFIAFFEREGLRYWIGLDTRDPFTAHKELFDRMILSLRTPDGARPGPELAAALEPIAQEGRYRFVQPAGILLLIPVAMILLIAVIQAVVRWRAGRLPAETIISSATPVFAEGGLELGLVRPFQRKFMDCAVRVTQEGLEIRTFGTPFMVVPRGSWRGPLETGQAWLGLPFVQLVLEHPPEFRKWAWAYRAMKGPLTLRIYTRNADRLRALLQS